MTPVLLDCTVAIEQAIKISDLGKGNIEQSVREVMLKLAPYAILPLLTTMSPSRQIVPNSSSELSSESIST